MVEETSKEADYATFREKLINAKSKDRKGHEGIGGRYAVYDVEYDLESGEGKRYVFWYLLFVREETIDGYFAFVCDVIVVDVEGIGAKLRFSHGARTMPPNT